MTKVRSQSAVNHFPTNSNASRVSRGVVLSRGGRQYEFTPSSFSSTMKAAELHRITPVPATRDHGSSIFTSLYSRLSSLVSYMQMTNSSQPLNLLNRDYIGILGDLKTALSPHQINRLKNELDRSSHAVDKNSNLAKLINSMEMLFKLENLADDNKVSSSSQKLEFMVKVGTCRDRAGLVFRELVKAGYGNVLQQLTTSHSDSVRNLIRKANELSEESPSRRVTVAANPVEVA